MKKALILLFLITSSNFAQAISYSGFIAILKTVDKGSQIQSIHCQHLENIVNAYDGLPHSTAVRQANESLRVWLGIENIENLRAELRRRSINETSLRGIEANAVQSSCQF